MNADGNAATPPDPAAPAGGSGLDGLTLDELAYDEDAARIVARLTRTGDEHAEPVNVAAFNSYI